MTKSKKNAKNKAKQQIKKPVVKAPEKDLEKPDDQEATEDAELEDDSTDLDNEELEDDNADLDDEEETDEEETDEEDEETDEEDEDSSKWEKAQVAEREQHTFGYAEGLVHYASSYEKVFEHVGLGKNLHGLAVIELGPADFPALGYCVGIGEGVVVEPMPSEHLARICEQKGLVLIKSTFEDADIDNVN